MNSTEVIAILVANGWIEHAPRKLGNHRHFRHPAKQQGICVPLLEEIPPITIKRLESAAGTIFVSGGLVKMESE